MQLTFAFRPLAALLMALALSLALPAPAMAQEADDFDIGVFYDELEGQGRWFRHPGYGEVWQPDVDDDWRPYTRGHWAYTEDHGWAWVSSEPWGWAVYHYGRWALDDEVGWIWFPGTEWAPAWVAWRESDDYIGWAPLPPDAVWSRERGLRFDTAFYDEPRYAPLWSFVAPAYLTTYGLHRYLAPPRRNIEIIGRSRPATRYDLVDRRIVNRGIRLDRLERLTGRPIPTTRLIISADPGARAFSRSHTTNLRIYRPDLAQLRGRRPGFPERLAAPPTPGDGRWRHDGGSNAAPGAPGTRRSAPTGPTTVQPTARRPDERFGAPAPDRAAAPETPAPGQPPGRSDRSRRSAVGQEPAVAPPTASPPAAPSNRHFDGRSGAPPPQKPAATAPGPVPNVVPPPPKVAQPAPRTPPADARHRPPATTGQPPAAATKSGSPAPGSPRRPPDDPQPQGAPNATPVPR